MKSNPFVLALRAALLVLLGILGHTAFAETDQTSAPIGEFIDPENLENIGKVQSGAEAARDAKRAKDLAGQGKYKDMAQAQFQKYQNSKVGLMTLIRKIQKKTHAVISKASERVDKWRTTVPKIRSYTRKTLRYADDSYDFATTFEMSDMWDIDRDFSREMEWRLGQGRRLGLSIWDFLVSRINREDFLMGIEGILFPDYVEILNRSALNGFHYVDEPSESEKVPLLVLHESLDVLNAVQQMAESQFSPSEVAPGLSRQQFDNHRIREALFDPRSGYTDQAALLQDIRNKQYEIAVQRSIVRDYTARLEILWGRLAAQKLEDKERATTAIAKEAGVLSGVELDPEAWILERFGLEDRKP
jgi:hypothetical protein